MSKNKKLQLGSFSKSYSALSPSLVLRVAGVLLTLAAGRSFAQNVPPSNDWTATTPSSWTQASNWMAAATPGTGDTAVIANGGTAQISSAVTDVALLSIRDGVLEIAQGGSLSVVGGAVLGGTGSLALSGNGAFESGSLSNLGLISLGESDASLSIQNDYSQTGMLRLATSGGAYPVTSVGGTARLGGTIDLANLPAGGSLSFGSSWIFLTAPSVVGQPSRITVGGAAPQVPRGLALQVAVDGANAAVEVGNAPILTVNRQSGAMQISNVAGAALSINGYSIGSSSGLLNPDSWNSLTDQAGAGWSEANPQPELLSELNPAGGELDLNTTIGLGDAYGGTMMPPRNEDLSFQFSTTDGRVLPGIIEYEGPANDLVLAVDPATGAASIRNLSPNVDPFEVVGYNIFSTSGSLSVDGWNSFAESGAAGDGWTEANPQSVAIAELNLTGSTMFPNGTSISIGSILSAGSPLDLSFEFATSSGSLLPGTVEYITSSLNPLDCNGDGVIDVLDANCATLDTLDDTLAAAGLLLGDADGSGEVQFPDFVILANNFGNPGQYTQGDFDKSGTVQFPDFVILANNFGMSAGAAAAVPEPATGVLAVLALVGLVSAARARRSIPTAGVLSAWVLMVMLGLFADNASAIDFDTRFIRIHPAGPNNQINDAIEARGILRGTVTDVLIAEEVVGKLDIIDLAGGAGSFGVNNPYANGVSDESMDDFLQQVTGVLQIPEGTWSIGFGSDDGGYITMPGISFDVTYNENGPASALVANDGEIMFNAPRGHAWTSGTFTVPAGGVTTNFEAAFYERGGGDDFEVAILDGELFVPEDIFNFGLELSDDGFYDWQVLDVPGGLQPGDFDLDGNVTMADFVILSDNFGTGTTLAQGDANQDGRVGLDDFQIFAANFTPAGAPLAGVPEPGGLALLGLASVLLLSFTRGRRS